MTIEQSVQTFWDKEALPALMDFIRIPAKSTAFDSHWQEHGYLLQACEKSKAWIESVLPQARCEILTQKDRTPCLFVDIAADGTTRDNTIAFYGHLDKQPEAGGWAKGLGPWEPVIRNGKFMKDWGVINLLKIRGSIGTTGGQNFSPYQAMAMYS